MIILLLVNARGGRKQLQSLEPVERIDFAEQITIACLIAEDGLDNKVPEESRCVPDLEGLLASRGTNHHTYFMRLKKDSEFKALYKISNTNVNAREDALPKHVIIGRRGHIYYIGPMMTNKELKMAIDQSNSDNSFAVDIIKNFKVQERRINKSEVANLFRTCSSFETSFSEELKQMIEYKIEIVEKTTYHVGDIAERSYDCQMLFVAAEESMEEMSMLIKRIEDL